MDPSPIIVFQFNVNDLSVIFVASNSCGCGGNISAKIEKKNKDIVQIDTGKSSTYLHYIIKVFTYSLPPQYKPVWELYMPHTKPDS